VTVIHVTGIVTIAHKNYHRYKDAVECMRHYANLGVKFKIQGPAAQDYDYSPDDFYDYIEVVQSAIIELSHWQQQIYPLITPTVLDNKYTIKEIR
jgi:intracellular sulfur oxidation DsrE/DsrF family protein